MVGSCLSGLVLSLKAQHAGRVASEVRSVGALWDGSRLPRTVRKQEVIDVHA